MEHWKMSVHSKVNLYEAVGVSSMAAVNNCPKFLITNCVFTYGHTPSFQWKFDGKENVSL